MIEGHGHNPRPVKDVGVCCSDCNASVVLPARMKALFSPPAAAVKEDDDSIGSHESIDNKGNLVHVTSTGDVEVIDRSAWKCEDCGQCELCLERDTL